MTAVIVGIGLLCAALGYCAIVDGARRERAVTKHYPVTEDEWLEELYALPDTRVRQ